ncbi:hypothetical protein DMUE_6216, partial [Dictyocoela muelleri]
NLRKIWYISYYFSFIPARISRRPQSVLVPKLGGIGSIVEVDESLMTSAKYGNWRYPEQTWVFGIVERGTGKCYLKFMPHRKKATLEKIISEIVTESTILCTDQAKVYGSLDEIGYIHFDVCHKKNFVDADTGAHTQTVESLWNHFKKKARRIWNF